MSFVKKALVSSAVAATALCATVTPATAAESTDHMITQEVSASDVAAQGISPELVKELLRIVISGEGYRGYLACMRSADACADLLLKSDDARALMEKVAVVLPGKPSVEETAVWCGVLIHKTLNSGPIWNENTL